MMKRMIACVLSLMIIFATAVTAAALEQEPPYEVPAQKDTPAASGAMLDLSFTAADSAVPKIEINTENGNGAALLKADGYVPAQISITDTDGSVLSGAVSFKVRGNSTAIDSINKKAFTFKFDKKTDVLGMGKAKKWALLANCFDPTLLRNYLVFDLADRIGLPYTSQQRFAELWLDGAYRGCYTLYEPIQAGKTRVDIDTEGNDGNKDFLLEYEAGRTEADVTYVTVGGLRFAVSEPDPPTNEQTAYITDTLTGIINTLRYGDEESIRQVIDVDSFAKYYLLNEYAKTADFGLSSVFFFYQDGKLYAGPVWDYDLALGNLNGDLNSTAAKQGSRSDGIMQSDKNIYRYLCNKAWFNNEIKRVYAAYYDAFEAVAADGGILDSLRDENQALFDRNFTVWNVGRWWLNYQKVPYKTYDENYRFLKTWCAERNSWLTSYYGLYRYTYLRGDADGNETVEIADATTIRRILSQMKTDDDGLVDLRASQTGDELSILDATAVQRYLAGMGNPYHLDEEASVMLY